MTPRGSRLEERPTAHPEFDLRRLAAEARLVVDTRNATGPLGAPRHVIRI